MRFRVFAIASLIAVAGCHFQTDPPGDPPSGVAVEPGDGRVIVTWTQDPELTYWIFYQPGSSVVPAAPGVPIIRDAKSPYVVTNLANGAQYAFIMNATKDDSSAGPSSLIVTETPRLAGAIWASGTALGTTPQNLRGVAFSGTTRLVAVGDSGTAFAGNYSYTSTMPPGVTAWLPSTFPDGFIENLSAVIHSGQFVALGTSGSILTSPDGSTWTLVQQNVSAALGTGMNGIGVGAGSFVAVGNGGSIFTSPDRVTWTPATSNTTDDLYSVSFLNGGFVATGANGTLLTSPNGLTWSLPQASNTGNALRGAVFRASPTALYVVVGDAGTIVTSTDAMNWSATALPGAPNLRSVTNGGTPGTRFLAVGQGGAVVFSDDGSSWSSPATPPGPSNLTRVLFAPGMYVAVGEAGANAFSK